MKSRGTTMGVMGLASETQQDFGAQARFLEALAHCAALALANALFSDGVQQKFTAQQQAHARQQRLIEILESTSDLVGMATPDTRLTYLNRAGRTAGGMGNP